MRGREKKFASSHRMREQRLPLATPGRRLRGAPSQTRTSGNARPGPLTLPEPPRRQRPSALYPAYPDYPSPPFAPAAVQRQLRFALRHGTIRLSPFDPTWAFNRQVSLNEIRKIRKKSSFSQTGCPPSFPSFHLPKQ
jgi:hypothetical protein